MFFLLQLIFTSVGTKKRWLINQRRCETRRTTQLQVWVSAEEDVWASAQLAEALTLTPVATHGCSQPRWHFTSYGSQCAVTFGSKVSVRLICVTHGARGDTPPTGACTHAHMLGLADGGRRLRTCTASLCGLVVCHAGFQLPLFSGNTLPLKF